MNVGLAYSFAFNIDMKMLPVLMRMNAIPTITIRKSTSVMVSTKIDNSVMIAKATPFANHGMT